jgi:hypothetical protein
MCICSMDHGAVVSCRFRWFLVVFIVMVMVVLPVIVLVVFRSFESASS